MIQVNMRSNSKKQRPGAVACGVEFLFYKIDSGLRRYAIIAELNRDR